MDLRMILLMLAVGLVTMAVTCRAAPVSEDVNLLTQLLKKANIVLDNIIAKQRSTEKTKQGVDLQLDQRNEDAENEELKALMQRNEDGNVPPLSKNHIDVTQRNEDGNVPPLSKNHIDVAQRNEDGNLPPLSKNHIDVTQRNEDGNLPPLFKKRIDEKSVGDISLEKVLKYLQLLRSSGKAKHEQD